MVTPIWQETVARHGATEAIRVPFHPSIRHLQDVTFCKTLHSDLQRCARKWERRKATADLWRTLPQSQGLYMFVWINTELGLDFSSGQKNYFFQWCLYIGQAGADSSTNTLQSRYRAEYANYIDASPERFWSEDGKYGRKERLRLLFSLAPLEYWFLTIEDQSSISNLETRLIRAIRPPGNDQLKNSLKPRQPIQAFREY